MRGKIAFWGTGSLLGHAQPAGPTEVEVNLQLVTAGREGQSGVPGCERPPSGHQFLEALAGGVC